MQGALLLWREMLKPAICFIDDSDFEHELVREEIAPVASSLDFIQAYTFEEAETLLAKRVPALFLLDLWGNDITVTEPRITTRKELNEKIQGFNTLEYVFEDLDDFKGDVINEYLKRFFSIIDGWRSLFEEVCDRVGQNRKYGLFNLRQVRKYYPGVPAVFYTRKSLISDAVAMFKAGADGLFIKPTGSNDQDTHCLTRESAPKLVKELLSIQC